MADDHDPVGGETIDAALDTQYNARASVPSFDAEYGQNLAESERVRQRYGAPQSFVYDTASGEQLDVFVAGPDTPVVLWVHGGYWRAGCRADDAFAAGGLLHHGVSVAVMDYTLAPDASLSEIVRQVRAAVAWLAAHGAGLGLRTDRIHVAGHSAGGHLVGMLLADGWTEGYGLPPDIIGVALAISGLHDVSPLPRTQVNTWLNLRPTDLTALSPIEHIPARSQSVLLAAVGGIETDAFQGQTQAYFRRWKAAGHAGRLIDMPGYNHFDVARTLCDPKGALVQAVLDAMQIKDANDA
jgi:arylformamidase